MPTWQQVLYTQVQVQEHTPQVHVRVQVLQTVGMQIQLEYKYKYQVLHLCRQSNMCKIWFNPILKQFYNYL